MDIYGFAMYNSIEEIPEDRYLETLLNQFEDEDEEELEKIADEDDDDGLDYPADEGLYGEKK